MAVLLFLLFNLGLLFASGLGVILYRITLHPLAGFPGPKLWAATRLAYSYHLARGRLHSRVKELHDKYGSVVRVAPNELSFIDGSAWSCIAGGGHRNKGFPKDKVVIGAQEVKSIVDSNDEDHTHLRRLLVRSFSSQLLEKQRSILEHSIQKFIGRLQQNALAGTPVDIVKWFNFLTFDITGELVFDESFNQLDEEKYHPWVELVCSHLKFSGLMICLRYFPPLDRLLPPIAPLSLKKLKWRFIELSQEKVLRRLQRNPGTLKHRDVVSQCIEKGGLSPSIPKDELIGTFTFLIIAGSETTATVLGGLMNYLCTEPNALHRVQSEVRAVEDEQDLDLANTAKMPYLNAILKEGLRLCTPVTSSLPRIVPEEGAQICGHFIPSGTRVGVPPFATNLSESNFHNSYSFDPERWLRPIGSNSAHEPAALQPFGYGGRNCVGQNLAWVMLRMIMARFLYHFDVEKLSGRPWQEQRTYILWHKEPLMVRLHALRQEEKAAS